MVIGNHKEKPEKIFRAFLYSSPFRRIWAFLLNPKPIISMSAMKQEIVPIMLCSAIAIPIPIILAAERIA
jgi:hypothetical protein